MKVFWRFRAFIKEPITFFKFYRMYKEYIRGISDDSPLKNITKKLWFYSKESNKEFFDHYDVFSFWIVREIQKAGNGKKILDVGGKKLCNAILSLNNDVYSIVLNDCGDQITDVKYYIHDISYPLPFPDRYFDIFTSPATLHLVGLSRYGDKLNPNALLFFLRELKRVLKDGASIYVLLPLGKDVLLFNHHYIFSFETIKKIFHGFEIVDFFVDEWSYFFKTKSPHISEYRFSKNTDISNFKLGEYKIIYLHLKKIRDKIL